MVRIPTSALIFREHGMRSRPSARRQDRAQAVKLGRNLGTEVEVIKGSDPDVVNSPPDSLAAGDMVRVAGKQSNAVGQISGDDVAAREQR